MAKFRCTKCGNIYMEGYPPEKCQYEWCPGTKEDYEKIIENPEQTIAEYSKKMLEEKIIKIHQLQADAGSESSSFGAITDIHWGQNQKHSAAMMEEILSRCAIPYYVNLGDVVTGFGLCDKESLFEDLDYCKRAFKNIESKCLMVEGNHDVGYSTLGVPHYYAENISDDEIYEHMFRFVEQYPNRHFGGANYYFADDTAHKMRYVVLACHDVPSEEVTESGLPVYQKFKTSAIRQQQMEWLANVALDVPDSDWTVTLFSHEALIRGWEMRGSEIITGILNAFKNHTKFEGKTNIGEPGFEVEISVDYTGRGGNFTAWICGHFHDSCVEVHDGINCISVINDSSSRPQHQPYERKIGTLSEHAFDIFTVDKKKRKIFITRIGAGVDREVEY